MSTPTTYDDLLARTRALIGTTGRIPVVGISGHGGAGTEDHPMPPVLIVEGIRLLSDRTRDWFDLAVWIDLDPDAAGARAKARNVLQGDDRAELDLWDTKWIPEGHDYERVERPHERADIVLRAEG